MYVEGRVLTTDGEPIAGAAIETWEADKNGMDAIGTTRVFHCIFTPDQGCMTRSMPTEATPTVGDDCTPEKMVALGIVLSFHAPIPFPVT